MKMEIQKKIWTSRYEKRGVNCGFCAYMRINSMGGSENFCQGGGGGGGAENSMEPIFVVVVFLVPNIFYNLQEGVQRFYYRVKLYFSKISEGVQLFPGGVQLVPGGGGVPNAYFYRTPPYH